MPASEREVQQVLEEAASGARKPVYLLIGEPTETGRVARALVDALVPESRRAFNYEAYDGRTTPVASVMDTLRTPGFFAGDKLVWLRESSVFLSGEKRGDVTRSMLDAWGDGRAQEAAERLLTLVAMAGWDEETWRGTRWQDAAKSKAKDVFGDVLEEGDYETLDAIQASAIERDLRLGAYRDEAGLLAEWLEDGVPPATVLVFTSSGVDARKKIVKLIAKTGIVLDLTVEKERSGSLSKASVEQILERVLSDFGKKLEPAGRELLLRRAGADAAALSGELEKLCLFVGDAPVVREADVRATVRDMAESWVFDLTGALAARDAAAALPVLRSLFSQGEPPLRLIGMIARELRMLLLARECLDGPLAGKFKGTLRYDAFQTGVLKEIDSDTKRAFGNTHPFVLFRRFQDASRMRAAALREALVRLSDLDLRIKSAPNDPAVLVEAFILQWCAAGQRSQPTARSASRPFAQR